MIFTRDQWREIKNRWNDSGREWVPNEIIQAAAEHDARELGIHQRWIDHWNDNNRGGGAWASCAYVLAEPEEYYENGKLRYSVSREDWVLGKRS